MVFLPCDDELERLASYASAHFGDDVLEAAGKRAIAGLTPLDGVNGIVPGDLIEDVDGQVYDVNDFWDAMRRELRRLMNAHSSV